MMQAILFHSLPIKRPVFFSTEPHVSSLVRVSIAQTKTQTDPYHKYSGGCWEDMSQINSEKEKEHLLMCVCDLFKKENISHWMRLSPSSSSSFFLASEQVNLDSLFFSFTRHDSFISICKDDDDEGAQRKKRRARERAIFWGKAMFHSLIFSFEATHSPEAAQAGNVMPIEC